ncbi:MAG: glycosyltransferase [Armatimonas sp.]
MLSQVRSLLDKEALLAAPPAVLAALSDGGSTAPFPLSPLGSLKTQFRDGRVLGRWAKGKADVLHGHGLARAPLFAIAAKTAGLPLVVTLHNLVPAMNPLEKLAAKLALSVARKLSAFRMP